MYYYQRRLLEEAAKYGYAKIKPTKDTDETSVSENWFGGSAPMSIQDAHSFLDDMEYAYKKGGLAGVVIVAGSDKITVKDMIEGMKDFFRGEPKNTISLVYAEVKKMLKPSDLAKVKKFFEAVEFSDESTIVEETINEGGVKAAIEDFMYDMLPKQAIDELKPIMKNQSIRGADLRNKVTTVLKKHKVPLMHLGGSSAQMVIDYFDTFHGESVEVVEAAEEIEEGVRMMAGAEKMVKDDPIGGSSMVSSLRKIKKSLEGKPTGSVLVVMKENDPESMDLKIYEPSAFKSLVNGLSKKPEAKVGSKGSWSGGEITVVAIKESVEEAYGNPFTPSVPGTFAAPNFKGGLKAGDKVKVPHKGKMVSGKIVRFDSGGTSKAQQHGGGYVVDVGEPASVLVPAHKIVKEEVEVTEAKEKFLTGPGKKDPKRLIGIYTMKGKWIKDMNSEKEAAAFVNKSWGESVDADILEGSYVHSGKELQDAIRLSRKEITSLMKKKQEASKKGDSKLVKQIDSEIKEMEDNISDAQDQLKSMKKEEVESVDVEITEQLANYRAFHMKTGQQITVQASNTKEAEAKGVEALKASNKKFVYVRYLGPVKEEVEQVEAYDNPFTTEDVEIISEDDWGGGFQSPADANKQVQAGLKRDFQRERAQTLKLIVQVIRGEITKQKFRKMTGRNFDELLKGSPYYMNQIKRMSKKALEPVVKEAATIAQQTKNTYAAREAQAKEIAAKILQVAKERGVRVYTDGQRVVSATKEFPKGDLGAFNKAYNDCGMVLTHMRFTKNSNQWGCESAGFGIGAQECVKAGRAQQHKSGDGGSLIIKFLKR